MNSQKNTNKTDESYKFKHCNCRLCFGCGTSMDNFYNYKCTHGNILEDSEKKHISMSMALYNYAMLKKKYLYDEEVSEQDLKDARSSCVNTNLEFLKFKGKVIRENEIEQRLNEMSSDDCCRIIRSMFDGCMIDIINSSISYSRDSKLDSEYPICCDNTSAICVPQCGHPICLRCLKGLVNKGNNQCPICKSRFYRIIVLREKMDSKTLDKFLNGNKDWIQQAMNE